MVVDFASPGSFLAAQNIGNSGMPGAAHYRDQFASWIDGSYHTGHLLRDRVVSEGADVTSVVPASREQD